MSLVETLPSYPVLTAALAGAAVAGALMDARVRATHPFLGQFSRLAQLGLAPTEVGLAVAAGLVAAASGLAYLVLVQQQIIVAATLVPVAGLLTAWLLTLAIRRRERRLRNQLADLAQHMAGAIRASLVPAAALEAAIDAAPKPLSQLLARAYTDYEHGAPLIEAIQRVADRLKLDAMTLFTTAVAVSMEHGSKLDEALGRIAASIRNQQALEDKLQALTASGRASIVVLAIFPFGFAGFFYQLDPHGYDTALESPLGQAVAGAAVGVTFLAVWWGSQILARVGR